MRHAFWRYLSTNPLPIIGLLVVFGGNSFAQPGPERLAAREGARQQQLASGYQSPTFLVDGAPRPLPKAYAPPVEQDPSALGRAGGTPGHHDRTSLSLSTITDEAGMEVPLGGDDVVITASPDLEGLVFMQLAADGTYFVLAQALGSVYIYKSVDKGESWSLWSTFTEPTAPLSYVYDFEVAEGVANRAMFAYVFPVSASEAEVRLAYADISAVVPTWTVVTALASPGVDHGSGDEIEIATDAASFSDYFVYLVASSREAPGGTNIWFTRSTNQGASFAPGYAITDFTTGPDDYFSRPKVSVGENGFVHVSYASHDSTGTPVHNTRYRRAASWANGGLASWGAEQTILAQVGSYYGVPSGISSSAADGGVYAHLFYSGPSGLIYMLRYSTDHGATWPSPNQTTNIPEGSGQAPLVLPGGDLVLGGTEFSLVGSVKVDVVMARSNASDPKTWSIPQSFSHHAWVGGGAYWPVSGMVPDPAFGNQIAVAWVQTTTPEKILRFDAEWRRDPGYPNTDIGFPIAIGGQTPPAVAEVDGDAEKEIVFGTVSGDIYVVNHDGTVVSGWPVNIGSMPFDAPVAVGDLVGNRVPSIVAGNATGQVYAFGPDGSLLSGWPVTMDDAADVFVSIGALGPPNPRYVVAVCGHEMRAIRYDGVDVSPLWGTFADVLIRPAAIGDVDSDGVAEIVTLKGSFFHVHNLNDFSSEAFRHFPGEFFSDAPTLADFDLDGTLEIAAPTMSGKMYLLNHDGSDFSASWPITVSPGIPLTAAALADFLGPHEVEMAFAEATGAVHVRWFDGIEGFSYPQSSGSSAIYMPPMLSRVNALPSNVNIGTTNGATGTGRSWRNLGAVPDGWPKNLPGPVEETFASGDIDNDGRNELVVLGVGFLTVLDVGIAPETNPYFDWPMYGHDAQRTGCLACIEILTGIGDTPDVPWKTGLYVHPNPFNPSTMIEYEVASAGKVSLEIFDVGGRRVAALIDAEHRDAGRYSIPYTATTASGIYFARLKTVGGVVTRKLVLLK